MEDGSSTQMERWQCSMDRTGHRKHNPYAARFPAVPPIIAPSIFPTRQMSQSSICVLVKTLMTDTFPVPSAHHLPIWQQQLRVLSTMWTLSKISGRIWRLNVKMKSSVVFWTVQLAHVWCSAIMGRHHASLPLSCGFKVWRHIASREGWLQFKIFDGFRDFKSYSSNDRYVRTLAYCYLNN